MKEVRKRSAGNGKRRASHYRAARVVRLGETLAGSAVATGDEAKTSAMVAVATRACTTKLRERRCSEAGRGEVKRNSISNQVGVDPERFIRQHASRRIHRHRARAIGRRSPRLGGVMPAEC